MWSTGPTSRYYSSVPTRSAIIRFASVLLCWKTQRLNYQTYLGKIFHLVSGNSGITPLNLFHPATYLPGYMSLQPNATEYGFNPSSLYPEKGIVKKARGLSHNQNWGSLCFWSVLFWIIDTIKVLLWMKRRSMLSGARRITVGVLTCGNARNLDEESFRRGKLSGNTGFKGILLCERGCGG